MSGWIDSCARMPQEGEIISLPGIKGKYTVRGTGLYEKDRLAIPISIVEQYKIEGYEEGNEEACSAGQ